MEAKSIVTQPSHLSATTQHGSGNSLMLDPIFAIANLIVLSTIAVTIYASIPSRKHRSSIVKPLQGMMCRRCVYFSDNHFVKCALHPLTVLTERAIECPDCQLKREAVWVKNLKNFLPNIYSFFTK